MKCKFYEPINYVLYFVISINTFLLIVGYTVQKNIELYGISNLYNSLDGLLAVIFLSILPSIIALLLNIFIFDRTIIFNKDEIIFKRLFKVIKIIKKDAINCMIIKDKWVIISTKKIDKNDLIDNFIFDDESICIHKSRKAVELVRKINISLKVPISIQ